MGGSAAAAAAAAASCERAMAHKMDPRGGLLLALLALGPLVLVGVRWLPSRACVKLVDISWPSSSVVCLERCCPQRALIYVSGMLTPKACRTWAYPPAKRGFTPCCHACFRPITTTPAPWSLQTCRRGKQHFLPVRNVGNAHPRQQQLRLLRRKQKQAAAVMKHTRNSRF